MKKLLIGIFAFAAAVAFADLKTALDAPSLQFTTGGDAEWCEQTSFVKTGDSALRSGAITHNGETWLETTVEGPGELSFWFAVDSERDCDNLILTIDDEDAKNFYGLQRLANGNGWKQGKAVTIDEGEHIIRWTYSKDGSVNKGEDCAWLDGVTWTPAPEEMTITYVTNGGAEIEPGTFYPGDTYDCVTLPERYDEETEIEYLFGGWFLDAELTQQVDLDDYIAYRDHTLYAKWRVPVSVKNTDELSFEGEDYFEVIEGAGADGAWAASATGYGELHINADGAGTLSFKYRTTGKGWVECYFVSGDDEKDFYRLCPQWTEASILVPDGEAFISFDTDMTIGIQVCDFRWTPAPEEMTVSFEMNGSGDEWEDMTFTPGDRYEDIGDPDWVTDDEDDERFFGGWFLDAELTQPVDKSSYVAFRDHTLYAKWCIPVSSKNTDGLTFDADNFEVLEGVAPDGSWVASLICRGIYDSYGDLYVFTDGPGTLSYKYRKIGNGWLESNVDSDGETVDWLQGTGKWEEGEILVVDGEVHFFVNADVGVGVEIGAFEWTPAPEEIKVTFDSAGGTACDPQTFYPGDYYDDLPTPERKGFEFVGWFEDEVFGRAAIEDFRVPFRDVTLVARWQEPGITAFPAQFTFGDDAGWRQIATADGAVLEAELTGYEYKDEDYTWNNHWERSSAYVDFAVETSGFLSFDDICVKGWRTNNQREGWAELEVTLSKADGDDGDKYVFRKEYYNSEWKKQYIFIPAGKYTLEFNAVGCGPCNRNGHWDDNGDWVNAYVAVGEPSYVRVRNMAFEPVGPQSDLGAWSGKLCFYRSWIAGDLGRFADQYKARITADTNDYEARILHAATIIAALAESDEFKTYAGQFGLEFDFATLSFKGEGRYGATSPAVNAMADAALDLAAPVLAEAMDDLDGIPDDWAGTVKLSASKWPVDEDISIDIADVMFARSAISGALATLQFCASYDLTVDWAKLPQPDDEAWKAKNPENREAFALQLYEEQAAFLSAVRDYELLAASGENVRIALSEALEADKKAVARGDDGMMHFVEYDPLFDEELSFVRQNTETVRKSLDAAEDVDFDAILDGYVMLCELRGKSSNKDAVDILSAIGTKEVYLGALFEGEITRALLPMVRLGDDGLIVPNFRTLRDPTFGGLLPGNTAEDVLAFAECVAPYREFDFDGYVVSFDANGGDDVDVVVPFAAGELLGELPTAKRTGYTFVRWLVNGSEITAATLAAENDLVAVAEWKINSYTIAFDTDGGNEIASITQNYGTAVTAPEHPVRDGYLFRGWEPELPAKMPAQDVTVKAKWVKLAKTNVEGVLLVIDEPYGAENLDRLGRAEISENGRHGRTLLCFRDANGNVVTADTIVGQHNALIPVWEKFNPLVPSGDLEAVDSSAAQTYDGYVLDASGNDAGTILVKVGKPNKKTGVANVSASLQMLGAAKLAFKAENRGKVEILGSGVTTNVTLVSAKASDPIVIDIGKDGISGTYGTYEIVGARNTAKKDVAAYAEWIGTYNVAFETTDVEGQGAAFAEGYSVVSVAVAAKGKVKVTGTMADGTKVSASAQLLVADNGAEACVNAFVPLYSGKKGGFGFVLWLAKNGGVTVESVSEWNCTNAKAPFVAQLAAIGGAKLVAPASGRTLNFRIPGEMPETISGASVLANYLPEGVAVTVKGTKFTVAKANKLKYDRNAGAVVVTGDTDNNAALKLTYTAKTGVLKGSFTIYTLNGTKLSNVRAMLNGAMVGGKGYGSTVIKNVGTFPFVVE